MTGPSVPHRPGPVRARSRSPGGSAHADGAPGRGDRAVLDDDGSLFFAGRTKDMLKVGGENVAAAEVERVVLGVAGVSEVAVVARSDDMLNEVPVAFVIIDGTVDAQRVRTDIADSCGRELAAFKVPKEIRLVDELPRSTLNKVAKGALRDQLAREQLGSGAQAGDA